MTSLDLVSSLDEIRQSWSPKAKERALAIIKKQIERDPRVWWCDFDRDEQGGILYADELVSEYVAAEERVYHRYLFHEQGCECEEGLRDLGNRTKVKVRHGRIAVRGSNCDGHPHGDYQYEHARSDQWPPSLRRDWAVWVAMSGRGAGKTKSGSEWTLEMASKTGQVAVIGRRRKDVVGTMVEGPSGLEVACARAGLSYDWLPSKLEFTLGNGAKILGYSAEEPDSLRGPEHGAAWLDEPAHMKLIEDVWSNMEMGLRVPGLPGGARIFCTSTPLPTKWLKDLVARADTITVVVPTYINLANLDQGFKKRLLEKYEGTRKGRQELEGEILPDVEGALWEDDWIKRVTPHPYDPEKDRHHFRKVIISIDPAGTANRRSDITGIIVLGIREDGVVVVLADHSGKYSPSGWARKTLDLWDEWEADEIIAEKNYGGDMVKQTLIYEAEKDEMTVKVTVKQATRSKQLRAEPVAALYEQGHTSGKPKVEHNGKLQKLEDEMMTWVPGQGDSPNRVDALVWGVDHLRKGSRTAKARRARGTIPARTPQRNLPRMISRR